MNYWAGCFLCIYKIRITNLSNYFSEEIILRSLQQLLTHFFVVGAIQITKIILLVVWGIFLPQFTPNNVLF
jgi:hypothetical protein